MAHLGELKRVKCYGTKCLYVMTAVHAQNLFSLFSLSERGTKVRYEKKGKIEREREYCSQRVRANAEGQTQ